MIYNKTSNEIATNPKWRMPGGNGHVENLGLDLNHKVRIFRLSLCNIAYVILLSQSSSKPKNVTQLSTKEYFDRITNDHCIIAISSK